MPDDVRRVKHLWYRMCERVDVGDGSEAETVLDDTIPTMDLEKNVFSLPSPSHEPTESHGKPQASKENNVYDSATPP